MAESEKKVFTLADLLGQRGFLPEQELIPVFIRVLRELELAHSQGQVHLDIKPSRIVGSSDNSYSLVEYGMSRLGTARYMSPERVQHRPPDARSDIYSLGVVLFEAATGRPPFDAEMNYEVLEAHVKKTPPLPRSVRPEISAGLQRVILTALAKDPHDRFQSARAFCEALEQVAKEQNISLKRRPESVQRKSIPGSTRQAAREPPRAAGEPVRAEPRTVAVESPQAQADAGTGKTAGNVAPARVMAGRRPPEKAVEGFKKPVSVPAEGPRQRRPAVKAGAPARTRKRAPLGLWLGLSVVGAVVALAVVLLVGGRSPKMPVLTGSNRTEAQTFAARAGLVLVIAGEVDDTLPAGIVSKQLPLPGTKVRRNDTLRVELSTGMVVVPRLAGMTPDEARQQLAERGLALGGVDSTYSDDYPVGRIAQTKPTANARIGLGTVVNLAVAAGRATCPRCRTRREPKAKFCTSCGYRFEE